VRKYVFLIKKRLFGQTTTKKREKKRKEKVNYLLEEQHATWGGLQKLLHR
jgi:hypothetical protein